MIQKVIRTYLKNIFHQIGKSKRNTWVSKCVPKLNQEEKNFLNVSITRKESEAIVLKNMTDFLTKTKTIYSNPDKFASEFYQTIKETKCFTDYSYPFYEASIALTAI